jgi:alanyl-tRNA synthetase
MGTNPAGRAFSVELCGGTHAARTGDIGLVSVVGESAVAAGVRRLEAMTGNGARLRLNADSRLLDGLAGLLKVPASEAGNRLAALIEERRKLERELSEARKKLAMGGGGAAEDPIIEIGGARLLARAVTGIEMKDLKSLADEAKNRVGSGVVAIVSVAEDGKAGIVVGVTQDMTERFDAVALVRAASEQLGGKGGGGRRDMAQAGGPDGDKAQAALDAVAAAMG